MSNSTLNPSNQLVRVTEVARHLSLSRSKIYQMMDAGELPYVLLGHSRRVPLQAVEQLVKDNTVGTEK
jgi:excisionase family DNA binding protein